MELADERRLRVIATDGHRLALAEAETAAPLKMFSTALLVPRKGIAEIRRLCDDMDGSVELGLHENFLLMRRPGLLLSARLIDARFPSYQAVLVAEPHVRTKVARELLLHAVRRIALVASDRSGGFKVALNEGELVLSAINPDLGEVREELGVDYAGTPFATSFDTRYVIDALSSIASKEVVLEFVDEFSPAQIRPADTTDQIAVVMPMRL